MRLVVQLLEFYTATTTVDGLLQQVVLLTSQAAPLCQVRFITFQNNPLHSFGSDSPSHKGDKRWH